MDDVAIVRQLVAGAPAGLAAIYDRYAARLFDYCVGMLRDRDAAGDALHDTLLVAADRAHQLRDPGKLRPWLYAIARNECLRVHRSRRRETELDRAGEVTDDNVDVERGLRAAEARALVRDAVAGLNPGDREVLDLTLRHELAGDELGAALGVSGNHANALVSRARAQLEKAVGALVMARTGRGECPELATVLAGWDGELTTLVRKRVNRHVEHCPICAESKRRKVSASALFAATPIVALPIELRRRVLESGTELATVARRRKLGKRAEPFDRNGFPVPLDGHRRRAAVPLAAGVLALVLLLGAGIAIWPRISPDDTARSAVELPTASVVRDPTTLSPPVAGMASAAPRTTVPSSAPPTRSSSPPAARPTVTATPPASPPDSPSPMAPAGTGVVPKVFVRTGGPVYDCPSGYRLSVTAVVSGNLAESATAYWNQRGGPTTQVVLESAGELWQGSLAGLPAGAPVLLRVDVVTVDGLAGSSGSQTLTSEPCLT